MESRVDSHLPDRVSYLLSLQTLTADERTELLDWLEECSDDQFGRYLSLEQTIDLEDSVIHDDDFEY